MRRKDAKEATMRRLVMGLCLFMLSGTVFGENYLINGGQESQIRYRLTQRVQAAAGTSSLTLSYVIPGDFQSPTYNQRVEDFRLTFSVPPSRRTDETDNRGNAVVRVVWNRPSAPIEVAMQFTASCRRSGPRRRILRSARLPKRPCT
jgi:hypothetical protein